MTSRWRVLMVSSLWPPRARGGAELYAGGLAAHLREAGHEVAVVTLGLPGPDAVATVRPWPHRLDAHRGRGPVARAGFHAADVWRPDTAAALRRAAARFRPDVVHSHVVAGMGATALTAPSRAGLAHVHTLHDYWLRCWRSTGTTRDERPCGPACDALRRWRVGAVRRGGPQRLIAISEAMREDQVRAGVPGDRVRVIRHPAPPVTRAPRTPADPPVLGFLGQLNPTKGVGDLLAAARRLAPTGVRVVIAGDGPLAGEVAGADVPGLAWRGWVTGAAKEAFLDEIDALVVPSRWQEPAGLVVDEAVSRGIPVIATAVGGLPEYVPPACRPLLCRPGDVDDLVRAVERLRADPGAYAVADPGRPDWSGHLDAVLDVYAQARRATRTGAGR